MNGQPPPAAAMGEPQQGAPGMPPPSPPELFYYDLSEGEYAVTVNVGRSKQTMMLEGAEEFRRILEGNPQYLPLLGADYFKLRDFSGAKELSETLEKLRDIQYPQLFDKDAESPEALHAKVLSLTQQLQQMQQMLEEATKAIETEQVKQQAILQKAQLDNQTKLEIERMRAETNAGLEQIRVQLEAMKSQSATLEAERQREHDRHADAEKRAHEVAMALKPQPPMELPLEKDKSV
jgi:hypothetical protein